MSKRAEFLHGDAFRGPGLYLEGRVKLVKRSLLQITSVDNATTAYLIASFNSSRGRPEWDNPVVCRRDNFLRGASTCSPSPASQLFLFPILLDAFVQEP